MVHLLPDEMAHHLDELVSPDAERFQRLVVDAVRLMQVQTREHGLRQRIAVQPRNQTRVDCIHNPNQLVALQLTKFHLVALRGRKSRNPSPPSRQMFNGGNLRSRLSRKSKVPLHSCCIAGPHPFWDPSFRSLTSLRAARTAFCDEPVHPIEALQIGNINFISLLLTNNSES